MPGPPVGGPAPTNTTPTTPAPTSAAPTNGAVSAALAELAGVRERPLAEHPDAFGRVHAGLQRALADIDDA